MTAEITNYLLLCLLNVMISVLSMCFPVCSYMYMIYARKGRLDKKSQLFFILTLYITYFISASLKFYLLPFKLYLLHTSSL